jgi:hypothetical protein
VDEAELKKLYPDMVTLEVSAFPKVDNQAEALRHSLMALGDQPILLLSGGDSSSLVLRMLDLYPGLREKENILGWVNVAGRLYGPKPAKKSGRALASVQSAPDQFAAEVARDREILRQEALVRAAPLGQGFPIVNLITLSPEKRPAENLRESLITEGKTWFVEKGSAAQKIRFALPLVQPTAGR